MSVRVPLKHLLVYIRVCGVCICSNDSYTLKKILTILTNMTLTILKRIPSTNINCK